MVKLDFDLKRDVPELTGKVILITGGKYYVFFFCHTRPYYALWYVL